MMRPVPLHSCAFVGALALFAGAPDASDETRTTGAATFAPPVRVSAGEDFLGAGRMYPSPALHDVDGDGRADVVIGDLFGKVTVAKRAKDGTLAAEVAIERRDGEPLVFSNW